MALKLTAKSAIGQADQLHAPFPAVGNMRESSLVGDVLITMPCGSQRRSWKRNFRARKSRDTRWKFSSRSVPSSSAGVSANRCC